MRGPGARAGAVALAGLIAALSFAAPAAAAGPPAIGEVWASQVQVTSARVHTEIDPNDALTGYHVDYVPATAYEANLGKGADGFAGGKRAPVVGETFIGSDEAFVPIVRLLSGLSPGTAYRYRFVAQNEAGQATSQVGSFATFPQPGTAPDACPNAVARQQTGAAGAGLLDCRAYELVSPVDKNGGEIDPPGTLWGGGVLQAAAGGDAVTYGSAASFGAGAQGAPGASQYISRRGAGWATENVTVPVFSGSFSDAEEGVPYRLFSADLARALVLNGRHCRGEDAGCPVANPPLAGSGAPAGYQNYYLRENGAGTFAALLRSADLAGLGLDPATFSVSLAGAAPDLRHVVLSTCAALTADATEAPAGSGCDPAVPNLYLTAGTGLTLVNVLPGESQGTPGAVLAAPGGAISPGGTRIYWEGLATGSLYLRAGGQTAQVDLAVGGGGTFETASADGSVAFFTKAGHLYRYEAGGGVTTDLTPAGGVEGVLGASADGGRVYYLTAGGVFVRDGGTTRAVAADADPANYPPATGTARVSDDGRLLLFLSSQSLTGADTGSLDDGTPTTQVYLYDLTGPGTLRCLSCNPTNGRPLGSSGVPGAIANGTGPDATRSYKPRVMTAGGDRVFFDSADALVLTDTNDAPDVYQWQAPGSGSCGLAGGCLALLSSGRSAAGAGFVDASSSGGDAFFLTDGSLVAADPGSTDLYDARAGGGFPEPAAPIPCEGDACQPLPPEPRDPAIASQVPGRGNPEVSYGGSSRDCGAMARRAARLRRRSARAAGARKARLAKRARVTAKAARRCRAANRRAAG